MTDACRHHICDDPAGLTCVREQGHPDGHRYEASAGPDLDAPHRHATQEDT